MTNHMEVSEEQIEAGVEAANRIEAAMRERELSDHPEDLPDYDEGDVARETYLAMKAKELPALTEDMVQAGVHAFGYPGLSIDHEAVVRRVLTAALRLPTPNPRVRHG